MTLIQLEYLLALHKHRNFSRAAEACHVTQPTLSALVKNLEEELGAVLIDRSKKPMSPTKMGALVIDQAKLILQEVERLEELVKYENDKIEGELKVGIIPTLSPYLLPLFLKSFYHKYDKVSLHIEELTTPDCLRALDNEDIDVAILATKESSKKYLQELLFEEKMLLYLNTNDPLAKKNQVDVDDLTAKKMWLLEEGHCLRDEIIKFCHLRQGTKNRPMGLEVKIGNLESLRYLVEENFGYTLLPLISTLRLSAKEKKCLKSFKAPAPKRSIYVTKTRIHLKSNLIQALQEEIIAQVKKHGLI